MDILIKGMEMPKEGHYYLEVFFDGEIRKCTNPLEGFVNTDATAIELPPHGRLKDESVIIENMGNAFEKLFPLDGKHKQTLVSECHVEFMRAVFTAPTVIESNPYSEGEEK